jgi:hypothetical protein
MAAGLSALCLGAAGEREAPGPVQDGLRLSVSLVREVVPPTFTLDVVNEGGSSRSVTVGSNDRWNVSGTLFTRDGKTHQLVRLPRVIVITGALVPLTINTVPHVPYRVDLPLDDFELDLASGETVKLSTLVGSGDRLLIRLHCGPLPMPRIEQNPWQGDLSSGWLTL